MVRRERGCTRSHAMKVAVMGTTMFGGLGTHFYRLLDFFIAEGHETHALAVEDSPGAFSAPRGLAGSVLMPHGSSTILQKVQKLAGVFRGKRSVRRVAPQLFVAAAVGRAYARLADHARRHGAFAIWQSVTCPPPGDALTAEMCRSVDAVAVQTAGMLAPLRAAAPGLRSGGTLPCFFDTPAADAIAAPPAPGGEIRLAYFGRLAGNKGLVPFLKIFRDVAAAFPVRLDIHGDGEERAAIERVIGELNLGGIVSLKGRYPDGPAYGELLASYHALVLPSTDCEGLPLVLLEAMHCGLPLLATDIGGMADVAVGNPDVVVTSPRADALADGLRRLAAMLRGGAISNARLKRHAAENFSNERFAATWRAMLVNPPAFFSK